MYRLLSPPTLRNLKNELNISDIYRLWFPSCTSSSGKSELRRSSAFSLVYKQNSNTEVPQMSAQDPNEPKDDVGELKKKLRRHEIKIAELEQQLQQVRDCATEKIKELEYEKKALENEVSDLKKRIKWLEDEVRYFSTKPVITDLKRELKEKDARMDSMEKSFESKLNAILNRMEMVEKKNQEQGKDLKFFTEKAQDYVTDLEIYKAKTDELEKSRDMLYIGQLCAKVMEAIYWEVLPVYFEKDKKEKKDYKQPHLGEIDQKIEELYQTRRDKVDARRRWSKLQLEKIDSDASKVKELVDFMEEMLAERNEVAHPSPLNEKELKKIASNLPGQKQRLLEKIIQISKQIIPTIFVF